jgi:hypothetical protein
MRKKEGKKERKKEGKLRTEINTSSKSALGYPQTGMHTTYKKRTILRFFMRIIHALFFYYYFFIYLFRKTPWLQVSFSTRTSPYRGLHRFRLPCLHHDHINFIHTFSFILVLVCIRLGQFVIQFRLYPCFISPVLIASRSYWPMFVCSSWSSSVTVFARQWPSVFICVRIYSCSCPPCVSAHGRVRTFSSPLVRVRLCTCPRSATFVCHHIPCSDPALDNTQLVIC